MLTPSLTSFLPAPHTRAPLSDGSVSPPHHAPPPLPPPRPPSPAQDDSGPATPAAVSLLSARVASLSPAAQRIVGSITGAPSTEDLLQAFQVRACMRVAGACYSPCGSSSRPATALAVAAAGLPQPSWQQQQACHSPRGSSSRPATALVAAAAGLPQPSLQQQQACYGPRGSSSRPATALMAAAAGLLQPSWQQQRQGHNSALRGNMFTGQFSADTVHGHTAHHTRLHACMGMCRRS